MKDLINKIIKTEAEALMKIPTDNKYQEVVNLIYLKIILGKVVTSGMGKAGQIALNIATTLSSIGVPAMFIHPGDARHGDIGAIQQMDVLLLISNSGKTREIIEMKKLARDLYNDIPVIVITGNPEAEICSDVNYVLSTGNPDEVCILGLTPTTSTTVMTVIGDILVVLLQELTHLTRNKYHKLHHGGYLGEQSKPSVVGIIPARLDSKRLSGKVLKTINGSPMIKLVYVRAIQAIPCTYIATSDLRVYVEADELGMSTIRTSAAPTNGTERCAEALAELYPKPDIIINIQADQPLIEPEDIKALIKAFDDPEVQIATLATTNISKDDIVNENCVKLAIDENSNAEYFSRDRDEKYKHIGVYGYRSEVLEIISKLSAGECELKYSLEQLRWLNNGYNIKVVVTDSYSLSIDTEDDLEQLRAKHNE